ncbi:MAG: hypothetical protein JWO82_3183, partial [Akkermansiaceae bacterium]|nr:hypothetical protein [Akkermansiaceae bacterium]
MDETGLPAGVPFPDAVGGPAFATLATRSLSPWPEIQHRVKAELMERIQYAAPGPEDDTLLQATARVQAGAAAPPRWRFGWTGLWFIFLALFCWGAWDSYVDHHLTPYPSQGRRNVLTPVLIRRMADLRPGVPIVAVEDNDIGRIAELEAKSMAVPDDPVLYQAWVLFHYANIGKLPDDFDDHWRRIDPGNAFWPALKASVLGKHLMYERRSYRSVSPTEEDLATVTAAMEEAARQPAWIDRQRSFLALQRAAFRPPYTLEEDQVTAFSTQAARLPGLPSADDCVQYQFDLLIARGDLTAAASLIDTWCRVAEMQLAQPGNPLPWYPPQATGISAGFSREVRKAGLTEQADRIDRLVKAAHSWYRYSATPPPGIRHLPEYYTDLYGGGSFDHDAFPERRMAEYASADRLAALWTAGFLLLVLLGILIFGSGRQKP